MDFNNRIGVFFLWIGTIAILLFFFSSIAEAANFNLLIIGFLLILFGSILWSRNRPAKAKSTRFRIFKPKPKQKEKPKDPDLPANKAGNTGQKK